MSANFPDRITGRSVEDIAIKLYDALTEAHPEAKRFRLDYPVINYTASNPGREDVRLETTSKDEFVEAFEGYDRNGKLVSTLTEIEGTSETFYCRPTDLRIYPSLNGQYSSHYYLIPLGVQNTSGFFTGFKYHRSLLKRFLISNGLIKTMRERIPSRLRGVESFLKEVLKDVNRYINGVAREPLYITIKQIT